MKKRISVLTAVMLCFALMFSLAACGVTTGDEDTTDEFIAATVDVNQAIPVSEAEIIAFYNDIVTKIQLDGAFTAENKPGLKTSESLYVDNLKVLAYDAETGEAAESDGLNAINKSAKALKDRVLGGIETRSSVIAFGDTANSFDSVIYPYDSTAVTLSADDVVKAESYADGNNLNISITLHGSEATVKNIFGMRDKQEVISKMNTECKDYLSINDYSVAFVEDAENNVYSTINLNVELEQQEDGTYKTTGRITYFNVKVIADVAVNAECQGSFKDNGGIQINFRLTDEFNYEFDWLGQADWSAMPEDVTE